VEAAIVNKEGRRMRTDGFTMQWMALAGAVLVVVGLLGFIGNPIVGADPEALLPTDALHNIVHLGTGALALFIAFGLSGENRVNGTIGFGVLYLIIFIAVLVSPTLFGLFSVPANAVLHVIHAALAVVSLAVGYMARNRARQVG
jgi:hypothetical protein